jgi:hypothetical protein
MEKPDADSDWIKQSGCSDGHDRCGQQEVIGWSSVVVVLQE